MNPTPARWQLPAGCTTGVWDYVHSDSVAEQYDEYFAGHKLLEFDQQFVCQTLAEAGEPGQLVADLGCGTGRALVALAQLGFRGLGVDLSEKMLEQLRRKAQQDDLPIETRLANWVELDEIEDDSVDHCVSLFSTLGMIHQAVHRQAALAHTRRILRRGGLLILHVHNFWFNLRDADGPWWAVRSAVRGMCSRNWERGDKYFPYRGVPQMFLHVFTAREIRGALRRAGFRVRQMVPIDPATQQPLRRPWLLPGLRAIGWMIVAQ